MNGIALLLCRFKRAATFFRFGGLSSIEAFTVIYRPCTRPFVGRNTFFIFNDSSACIIRYSRGLFILDICGGC